MKKLIIGPPCGRSAKGDTVLLNIQSIACERIVISYGGGIGGTTGTYFAKKSIDIDNMLEIVTVNDIRLKLNPRFVVLREPCRVLMLEYDVSGHNMYDGTRIKEYLHVMQNETYNLSDEYTPRHTGDLEGRVIHGLTEVFK